MSKMRSGTYLQSCSADYQTICASDHGDGFLIGLFRKKLSIQGHIRTDEFSAFAAMRHRLFAVKYKILIIFLSAGYTMIFPDRSMYLLHIRTSGLLMKAIDILCDDPL